MLYPKEDKENKVLLYAVSNISCDMLLVSCTVVVTMNFSNVRCSRLVGRNVVSLP